MPQIVRRPSNHQRCGCVSNEEMFILQALAETAINQRHAEGGFTHWWRLLVPAEDVAPVDAAARAWLAVLNRAGVVFPSPAELVECLQPLHDMAEPAPAVRMH